MPTQPTQFVGVITGANPFVALQLSAALTTAGFTRTGLTELIIIPISSGNLVLSSDSTIAAEAAGQVIPTTGVVLQATGQSGDVIQTSELYLFSATASKAFSVYARALP